jgi:CIC family chloride channel protein
MLAVATEGGAIRGRVAPIKILASSLCIGSGGSAGREGPIVQIGSSLGSMVARLLRLPRRTTQVLVACGAAGGISATFNTPLAGVVFALEVILQDFAPANFGIVVIASVTAWFVANQYGGGEPAFGRHDFGVSGLEEMPLYLGLAVACALSSTLFSKGLHVVEERFESIAVPEWVRPAIGGALVGLIAIWMPRVMGVGYGSEHNQTVHEVLGNGLPWMMCLWLAVAKIVATWLTLGSGGSGGVFAPCLFIGATLGYAFGNAAVALLGVQGDPRSFALAGMAGVFAGASRAPMTAVLTLFEMSQDYRLILAIMACAVVSSMLAQRLTRESIYTVGMKRRGIHIDLHSQAALMDAVMVKDAMTPIDEMDAVAPDMSVADCYQVFARTGHHGMPVIADDGALVGVVTIKDLGHASGGSTGLERATVNDVCTHRPITAYPDMTVNEALAQPGAADVGRLPVIERLRPHRVVGVLRRDDIVRAYARASAERAQSLEKLAITGWLEGAHVHAKTFTVKETDAVEGTRVDQLHVPEGVLLAGLRRGNRVIIPKGDTILSPGDRLSVVIEAGHEADYAHWLNGLRHGEPEP